MKNIMALCLLMLTMIITSCDYMEDLSMEAGLNDGLVAYWPVTETAGSAVKDYSGKSISLTPLTGFTFADGKFSKSLSCDGANSSKAEYNGYDLFKGKNSFSLTMWTKLNYDASNGRFIALCLDNFTLLYGESTSPNLSLAAYIGDGSGVMTSVSGVTIKADVWNHLAVVFSGKELSIFVNGIFAKKGEVDILLSRIDSFTFGGTYSESDPMMGQLDEIRIYNRALKQDEIKALMKTGMD